jgi:hypothetical protein
MSATARSAQVTYTDVAVTSRQFKIAAFADYDTGLPTAGAWSASPTRIVNVGAGQKLPGDMIGYAEFSIATNYPYSSVAPTIASPITMNYAPTSPCNAVVVQADGDAGSDINTQTVLMLYRGSTQITQQVNGVYSNQGAGSAWGGFALSALDFPRTTATTAFAVYFYSSVAGHNVYCPQTSGHISVRELVG